MRPRSRSSTREFQLRSTELFGAIVVSVARVPLSECCLELSQRPVQSFSSSFSSSEEFAQQRKGLDQLVARWRLRLSAGILARLTP